MTESIAFSMIHRVEIVDSDCARTGRPWVLAVLPRSESARKCCGIKLYSWPRKTSLVATNGSGRQRGCVVLEP
jgi:hypothetical protein